MNDTLIRLALIVIAAITIVTGFVQMVVPAAMLNMIAAESSISVQHTFATVGMFMVITGAMFMQSLLRRSTEAAIPLWIGVQKTLAATLVAWGVSRGVFGSLAYAVAGFDLVSGVLAFLFLSRKGK
ncbi:MAG TPA: hypothetical protein PLO50_07485 [Nitrospira sp.]|nr:hypothetical protein [Nitrospira sp.]